MDSAGRRQRIALVVLAALLVSIGAACDDEPESRPPQRPRPNIVVIMTDDQRAEGTMVAMPFTRRYFKTNGTVFERAYVVNPLCCPSRASLFTGRYPHNHGVIGQMDGDDSRLDQETTIQSHLKDQGYRTGMFGKYLNGWPLDSDPPFFDEWAIFSNSAPNGYVGGKWNVDGSQKKVRTYSTTYLRRRAVGFIRDAAEADSPYLLFVDPAAPHVPYTAEPKYRDAPLPPFTPPPIEEDRTDKAPFIQAKRVIPDRWPVLRDEQLRTLLSVDDLVKAVVREVRAAGDERDTILVFTSDNGYIWGENGITGKMVPYTHSIKVPMMIAWPGEFDVKTDLSLVHNVDLTTTLAEAARIDMPTDGLSLLGTARHEELFVEFFNIFGEDTWRSVVTRTHQYIQYYDPAGENVTHTELYDLVKDPAQHDNLVADGRDNPVADELAEAIERYEGCRGRDCVR